MTELQSNEACPVAKRVAMIAISAIRLVDLFIFIIAKDKLNRPAILQTSQLSKSFISNRIDALPSSCLLLVSPLPTLFRKIPDYFSPCICSILNHYPKRFLNTVFC